MIIDAHLHLWDRQCGRVDEKPVFALCEGKSNFGGEIRQMMPPYMLDGRRNVDRQYELCESQRLCGDAGIY